MLFNSLDFAVFLPIVFCVYWAISDSKQNLRNVVIVISSCVFYGWWDWRFLLLIFLSTVIDFFVALAIEDSSIASRRKLLLLTSISMNLGLLGFFKYCNFFLESFQSAFSLLGRPWNAGSLAVILPVGISFYTFQTLSYSIDVYRKKLKPTRDFVAFAAYVSFFPQLVAGPIERATHLLPQFLTPRHFDFATAVNGLRQILWGLFKKIAIADNCAQFANLSFNHSEGHAGSTLALGAIFFAVQIYCDFSGYSDIAIGTSRLFGFDLMKNFAFPYFSRDIAEFWRRWHISLSTWFRDYVYIPIGGSSGGIWQKIRNVFVVFLISGLWHGANWTFVAWGIINALFFLPLLLLAKNRNNMEIVARNRLLPTAREAVSILTTFLLTSFAWIFFRAETIGHAVHYIRQICSWSLFQAPVLPNGATILLVAIFFIIEWHGRESEFAIERIAINWPRPARWAIYYGLCLSILLFAHQEQDFIYFQF